MASFTIKSRDHGEVTFRVRDEGGYITVTSHKWDHKQPCDGGGFMGVTLMSDEGRLEKDARHWWKQYLANRRLCDLHGVV